MWIGGVVGVRLQSIEVRLMFFLLLVEQYFRFMKRDWVTRQYVTTCRINFQAVAGCVVTFITSTFRSTSRRGCETLTIQLQTTGN